MVETNDFINQNTGEFDPRHLFGVTNQDVFRWPAIKNGTEKDLLGLYITTMLLPGIPIIMWGEEQAIYVLENTDGNYLFGRSPMSSALAWQIHGCYTVGTTKYANFPLDAALYGCEDDNVALDHRDPSHPVRNILKRMYELRTIYETLNDGFALKQLSSQTYDIYLPNSEGAATETGFYSVMRTGASIQDFSDTTYGNQSIWLLYQNDNSTIDYSFNCSEGGLYSPYPSGTTVKNLFAPYEERTLIASNSTLSDIGVSNSTDFVGCLSNVEMLGWGFKAYVPVDVWVGTRPSITKFIINNRTDVSGHDFRLQSQVDIDGTEDVSFEVQFSDLMDCDSVKNNLTFESNTVSDIRPTLGTVVCQTMNETNTTWYSSTVPSKWRIYGNFTNVANGVHSIVFNDPVNQGTGSNQSSTGAKDRFLFRIGQSNNPMVFPSSANYSMDILHKNSNGDVYISQMAPGATKFRYSRDWQSSWSDWADYTADNVTLDAKNWTGTSQQAWSGEHVIVQYWSNLSASSNHYMHGDLENKIRRYPHMFVQGEFNQYSYDTGLPGTMKHNDNGTWHYDFMYEWPTSFQFNEWGLNPDGKPDQTLILGDIDNDNIMDRLPPSSLVTNIINVTEGPASPHVAWRITMHDGSSAYKFVPIGNRWGQLALFVLLAIVPALTAAGVIYIFIKSFYHVKFNQIGVSDKQALIPLAVRRRFKKNKISEKAFPSMVDVSRTTETSSAVAVVEPNALQADAGGERRTVLIATMEYDIQDWAIKIKIGGLGVMAQLMGNNLGHQDIIWVVPCVQGIDYPVDTPAESIFITVLDKQYEVEVQYHVLRNVTYVLLDAPIFRKQSKTEPYPERMDDLESAIYYSAWNQCIAETAIRFNVSIYHINDYHGALAPLYLLPKVIPACLSLHNAEFQGLWPMRTPKEVEEVCKVFNLDPVIAKKYVQFGEVFNLLHAGASYLRIHQKGFGAVGVSKKYGKRSFARYPIFWGLSKIGSLPNPDPTDTAEWERDAVVNRDITVNAEFEAKRPDLKRQAQEWAGLTQDAEAELFVFVGRWSMQKGVDLIADVFPSILEAYPKVQLICVGPVIDLYGRFAALKLDKMMELYPGRVYSKPEFTALPPYIFSGSEFALIPSRDEPFGLVAVEFGRKGALGVGARVGGLGQMPGWWYSIESMTPKHLVHQFKMAIHEALASSTETRALMRARSAEQRFPVAQWVEDTDILQSTAIRISHEENSEGKALKSPSMTNLRQLFGNFSSTDLRPPSTRHGSTLGVPSTPGTPTGGQFTPSALESPSLRASQVVSPGSPQVDDILLPPPNLAQRESMNRRFSTLSYDSVAGDRHDFALQKVDPSFTDASGVFSREFEKKLEKLTAKSSENLLNIEENLIKSEKKYFNHYRDAKMGYASGTNSRAGSFLNVSRPSTPQGSFFEHSNNGSDGNSQASDTLLDSFPLGADYRPPTGIKRLVLYRVGDWPIYTILLAFGQIIAANSYQVSLLVSEVGETAEQLYIVATIYAVASVCWWMVFRTFKSVYCLSVPFALYGLAFLFIGIAPYAYSSFARGWLQNVATGLYAFASSSGSMFFALNFGDEGGAPIKSWVLRACIVQGTQQIYISALWYWGSTLVKLSNDGVAITSTFIGDTTITAITIPVACLMWAVGLVLFIGLPKYYRQTPGAVPSFYHTIYRRKIILVRFPIHSGRCSIANQSQ
jgi:alpha-1,3-glucan synthase